MTNTNVSWVAQNATEAAYEMDMLKERVRELESKIERLSARGIEDMQHRIRDLEARLKAVRKVADNRSMLDDYEAQYIYSALGDFDKEQSDE